MVPFRHVVLVGLSGSGKTSAGRILAQRLRRPFVDTDEVVVGCSGRTIPEIFARDGEGAFRELERGAIAEAVDGPPAVIATGGGAVVDLGNRRRLWEGNLVVWLDAPVATLAGRLGGTAQGRPLLAGRAGAGEARSRADESDGGVADRLARLREARQAVYAEAHLHVSTAGLTPDEVAARIGAVVEGPQPLQRAAGTWSREGA